MPVTYFDPSYLKSYIQTGLKLKVFVDGMYLVIPSTEDLDSLVDSKKGVGYVEGKPVKFDYRDIDHLKVGSLTFSKDLLNKDRDVANKGDDESDQESSPSDEDSSSDEKSIDSIDS